MKIKSLFQNITIKQANVFTITVIFLLTMIFVGLLVEEMHEDYEKELKQSHLVKGDTVLDDALLEQNRKKLKALLIKTVLAIVTLSFILFAIFLGLNNLFNRFLQRDTTTPAGTECRVRQDARSVGHD